MEGKVRRNLDKVETVTRICCMEKKIYIVNKEKKSEHSSFSKV